MGSFDDLIAAHKQQAPTQQSPAETAPAASDTNDEGFVAPFLDGAYDTARGLGTGVRKGIEQAIGLPGTVGEGMSSLNNMLRESMGFGAAPSYAEAAKAGGMPNLSPTMEDVNKASEATLGEHYKPTTTAGEYAETAGEFLPGMFIGGNTAAAPVLGGAARAVSPGLSALGRMFLGETVAPAVASETAGQATEGTEFEPYARAAGALAGGVGGALATRPRQAMTAAQREREELLNAANRRDMTLPEYMMPDSPGARVTAERMADLPFLGAPVRAASERTARQMGERVEETARAAAPSGNPDYTTATVNTSRTLDRYMSVAMPRLIGQEYDALDNIIQTQGNPTIRTPLTNTRRVVDDLIDEDARTGTNVNRAAVDMVARATRGPGLPYGDLRRLRSVVYAMRNDNTMPNIATTQPALKRLNRALTDDLRRAINRAGGQPALDQWERANATTRSHKAIGENVQAVRGKTGSVPADLTMDRLRNLGRAQDDSTEQRLNMVRMAADFTDSQARMSPHSWDNMAAAVMNDLGTDPARPGRFSPDNFAKEYAKLSEEGREIYWPDTDVRAAVDDFAALSRGFVDAREPSKWAMPQSIGTAFGLGFSGIMNPLVPLGAVASSYVISRLLSRRASAQKLLSWARARQAGGAVAPNVTRALAEAIAEESGEDAAGIAEALGAEDGGSELLGTGAHEDERDIY